MAVLGYAAIDPAYFLRSETAYTESEKRLLFLRSYQFSRKQTLAERIKKTFFGVKKVIYVRFGYVMKLRRRLWISYRNGFVFTAGRGFRFRRLHAAVSGMSSCF